MPEEARSEDANARIAALEAQNAALIEQIARLTARIDQLLELLGQTSKNSHKPPSSDGAASRGPSGGNGKPKSGRKTGGQKGHEGSHCELLPVERVDTFVELYPEVCLGCGGTLAPRFDDDARRLPATRSSRSPTAPHGVASPRYRMRAVRA